MKAMRFQQRSAWNGKVQRKLHYCVTKCFRCPKEGWIQDNSENGLPAEAVAQKLRQLGWKVGARAGTDMCPTCAAGSSQRRAAYCRIAGVPKREPKKMTAAPPPISTEGPPVRAPDPRQPTREDRRRIQDSLDEHYDVSAGRYTRNFTDEVLGKKLDVPRAWVTEVREMFFGPETNEAEVQRDAAVEALTIRCKKAEDRCMELATEFEAMGREIAKLRR